MADSFASTFAIRPIGHVESPLTSTADAPRQGDEGAPHAHLILDSEVHAGLDGIAVGDEIIVLTWLHEADRRILTVHPRGDLTRPEQATSLTLSAWPVGGMRSCVVSTPAHTPNLERLLDVRVLASQEGFDQSVIKSPVPAARN